MFVSRIVRWCQGLYTGFVTLAVSAALAGAQSLGPNPSPPLAPEIDAGTLGGAVAMLICGALIFLAKGQTAKPSRQPM